MPLIAEAFSADHRRCDTLFADTEQAVSRGDRETAAELFSRFQEAMAHHLKIEETVLFPALEACTGTTGGPTSVMRMEHEQMRGLLAEMGQEMDAWHTERYLGLSETLLILMQQHNTKEEHILYLMADQTLAGRQEDIISRLSST